MKWSHNHRVRVSVSEDEAPATPCSTLFIFLCEDREIERTFPHLSRNVLKPLGADLAIFGVAHSKEFQKCFKYRWVRDEPSDWRETISSVTDIVSFDQLASVSPMFLGGAGSPQAVGSGAIIFYWRYLLGKLIFENLETLQYEWFAIARSDFLWLAPFPPIKNFNRDRVYFLDGERYGGVSDRFVLFHRSWAAQIFSVVDPIFESPGSERDRLIGRQDFNPESYLFDRWTTTGVMNSAEFLPYLGFAIRSSGGSTRWSVGVWNDKLQAFVKYQNEFRQARLFSFFVKKPCHWKGYPGSSLSLRRHLAKKLWYLSESGFPARLKTEIRMVPLRMLRLTRRRTRPSG